MAAAQESIKGRLSATESNNQLQTSVRASTHISNHATHACVYPKQQPPCTC